MGKKAKFEKSVLVDLTEVLARLERVEEGAGALVRMAAVLEKLAKPQVQVASVVLFGMSAEAVSAVRGDTKVVPFIHCSTHKLTEDEVLGEIEVYRPIAAGAYVVVVGPASLGYLTVGHVLQSQTADSNGPLHTTTVTAMPGSRIMYSLKRW